MMELDVVPRISREAQGNPPLREDLRLLSLIRIRAQVKDTHQHFLDIEVENEDPLILRSVFHPRNEGYPARREARDTNRALN